MKGTLVIPTTLLFVAGTVLLAPGLSAAAKGDDQKPVYPAKAATMKIDGTLQFRFTHVQADSDEDLEGVNSFEWVRARLRFSGNLSENLYYAMRFQGDNLPVRGDPENAKNEGRFGFSTTYLGYHLGEFGDVEVGRFDVEATPRSNSGRQAFADRPFHVEENKASGQLGLTYSNAWLEDRVVLSAGVYNGNGDHSPEWSKAYREHPNDNRAMMYAGRLYVSPNAKFPFDTESDLKHSEWGVGAVLGGWHDKRNLDAKEETWKAWGASAMVRGQGLFALVDYTKKTREATGENEKDTDFYYKGWSTQVSYVMPVNKKLMIEPKARYERFKTDDEKAIEEANDGYTGVGDFAWTTVGFNLYVKGFDANFNVDYIFKKEKGDIESVKNDTLMLQANMYF